MNAETISWDFICQHAVNYAQENHIELSVNKKVQKTTKNVNAYTDHVEGSYFNQPMYGFLLKRISEETNKLLWETWHITGGTIHTFELLLSAKSIEESIAIGLYAYLVENKELMDYEQRLIAKKIIIEIRQYLNSIFEMWHPSMKYLLPEKTFIDDGIEPSPENLIKCALNDLESLLNDYYMIIYFRPNKNEDLSAQDFRQFFRKDE